jgi:hypothetical protein
MAFDQLNALHYTITNLKNCFWFFSCVSVLMFFSVMGSFDQKHRWAFWQL